MLHPQKLFRRFSILLFSAFILQSCTVEDSSENEPTTYNVSQAQVVFQKDLAFESNLLQTINEYLASINQSEVTLSPEANQIAFEHTKHLIESNSLHHENFPERQSYFYSLGFSGVRENVAMGIDNAPQLIQAWLQSPSHRQAIEANNTHTGISVLKNENGMYFITQIYLK
ncbi:MAG: CAP domain-containing protein [Flavobacteriaceae bacterium]